MEKTKINLNSIIKKYDLTEQQKEVFVERVVNKKDYKQIAIELSTSENACQKCMGEVYKKFNISGDTRGKEKRLIKIINSFIDSNEDSCSAIEIVNKLDTLIKNKENFDVEEKISNTAKILESIIYSISSIRNTSTERITNEVLETLKNSYLNHQKIILPQSISNNLKFILEDNEHSLSRSLFAFIERSCIQLNVEDYCIHQVILFSIAKIKLDPSHLNYLKQAPSAILRKNCFEQLLKIKKTESFSNINQESFVAKEISLLNMRIIKSIINNISNSKEIVDGYELLEHRYNKGLSFEQIANDWASKYKSLKNLNAQERINSLMDKEEKIHKHIRIEFHKIKNKPDLSIRKDNFVSKKDAFRSLRSVLRYVEIASFGFLKEENINELNSILNDSIHNPFLDFWINEVDHFIAHEREDLKSFEEQKANEAKQKQLLIKYIHIVNNIYGQNRFRRIIDSLKTICSPVFAISSGDIVSWWNSTLGIEYLEINKSLLDRKIPIKRVFIINIVTEEIQKVLNEQQHAGIEVRYLLNKDNEPDGSITMTAVNLLVCDEFTTSEFEGECEEHGKFSKEHDDIALAKQRFESSWDAANTWNESFNHLK